LVCAIARVAAALGCTFTIEKITRCSNSGAELADHLSKGNFAAFYKEWPSGSQRDLEPAWIPPAILAWIDNPSDDPTLGDAILRDLAARDGGL
jgi:hypothetical protein